MIEISDNIKPKNNISTLHLISYNEKECNDICPISLENIKNNNSNDKTNWLNINGLEPKVTIEEVADIYNFDEDITSDILDTTTRTKLVDLDHTMFFTIKSLVPENKKRLEFEQISFVLKKNILISIQEREGDYFENVRKTIKTHKNPNIYEVDYLLHLLLETIVDNYYSVLDMLVQSVEAISNFESDKNITVERNIQIEAYKRKLYRFKKIVSPLRDILIFMEKGNNTLINQKNIRNFIDLREHCSIIIDEIDYQNQRLESASNMYFSLQNNKLNEIMKTLTMITAFFIPLTFITGWYGMNFEHMPELKWEHSYLFLIIMMTSSISILFYIFKRKKWF